MCTQDMAYEILGKVYAQCKPILGDTMKDAYLYGSYARGDFHEESDIDIMLLVDIPAEVAGKRYLEIAPIESELSLEYDITISVILQPSQQFQQYADILPFFQNVMREGIRYAG